MSYQPYEPQGDNAFLDWARRTQREAFIRRKLLVSPNSIVTQTTQGVFTKPKPQVRRGGGNDLPYWL